MRQDEPPPESTLPADAAHLVVIGACHSTFLARRFVLTESPTLVGQTKDNHIVLPDGNVSRRHARFERRGDTWFVVDLDTANGVGRNDEKIDVEGPLQSGDRVTMGRTIFRFFSGPGVEAQMDEEARRATLVDALTGLPGSRRFAEALEEAIAGARAEGHPLSILLLELRPFEGQPDLHDLWAEQSVEREIARVVAARPLPGGLLAHTSSLHLGLILPGTPLEGALVLGEELRLALSEHVFWVGAGAVRVTAIAGAALLIAGDHGAYDLVTRAERGITSTKMARSLAAARARRAARRR